MAESSLSISRTELRLEVAAKLGYGRTAGSWTTPMTDLIDSCINSGTRQFYAHPIIPAYPNHEWSFLKPVTSLTTSAPYSTGTVTVVSGVVTLASGTWPSWAASGVFIYSNAAYEVSTRDSGTQITLNDTSLNVSAGASYEINQQEYDLPDSFGGLLGTFTFQPNTGRQIQIVGEQQIREIRQDDTSNGEMQFAAIRHKSATGTTGQRFEVMFYPAPDAAYILNYRYTVLQDALSSSYPYPLGGMLHAETLLQSCLAVAEHRKEDQRGPEHQKFMELLEASVIRDSNVATQEFWGYNGDSSDRRDGMDRYRNQMITFNGTQY